MKKYVNPEITVVLADISDVIKTSDNKVTAENSTAYASLETADVGGVEVQYLDSWF